MNYHYLKNIFSAKVIFVLVLVFAFAIGNINKAKSQTILPANYKNIVGFNDTIFAITDSIQWFKFAGDSTIKSIIFKNYISSNNIVKAKLYKKVSANQLQLKDSAFVVSDLSLLNNIIFNNVVIQNNSDYFIELDLENNDPTYSSARMMNGTLLIPTSFCPNPLPGVCNLINNPTF